MNTYPVYIIQAKRTNGQWGLISRLVLFNVDIRESFEAEIRDEMRAYGPIAIRCQVEVPGQPVRYLFPDREAA